MENEPRKFRISRKFTKFLWSDLVLLFADYFVSQESISKGIFKQRSKKKSLFSYKLPLKNGNAFVCCRLDKGFVTEFFASINN